MGWGKPPLSISCLACWNQRRVGPPSWALIPEKRLTPFAPAVECCWSLLDAPTAMLPILFMPFLFLSLFGGDAIAGERERHTLETLLASRISDPAILLGKTIVMVGTAWGMALASLLLGLLSANLASGQGRWAFYRSFGLLVEALALSLLTSLLATSIGLVISRHSATARQAQQLVMVAMLVLLVGVVVIKALPARAVSTLSASQIWLIALVVLAVLDMIFLGVLLVRFRRSRVLFS